MANQVRRPTLLDTNRTIGIAEQLLKGHGRLSDAAHPLNELQASLEGSFVKAGMSPAVAKGVAANASGLAAAGIGAAVGGLTIEQLRESGKTWSEIIESASRPGGRDLNLSPPGFIE